MRPRISLHCANSPVQASHALRICFDVPRSVATFQDQRSNTRFRPVFPLVALGHQCNSPYVGNSLTEIAGFTVLLETAIDRPFRALTSTSDPSGDLAFHCNCLANSGTTCCGLRSRRRPYPAQQRAYAAARRGLGPSLVVGRWGTSWRCCRR